MRVVFARGIAGLEVENAVLGVDAVSGVAEPVVDVVAVVVVEPEVVFVVDLEVSEPGVVFVAFVPVADVAEPQAHADIAVAFAVLLPVSVVAFEVDSSGRPKFLAFVNVDHFLSSSSSVEGVDEESVRSSTGARTNYGLCSTLSNLGLHQNRNLEQRHNKPNRGHNTEIDTSDLPTGATTNHSKKTSLYLYQEQHKHRLYQV